MELFNEVRAYRDQHQCGIYEAKRVVMKRRLIADAVTATTIEELRQIVLRLIEMVVMK